MSLLLLKTRDLTWQDHTLNTEVMLAPTRSGLLLNKHKTLAARCQMDKNLYERQRIQCIKDFLTSRRMVDRQRQKLVQIQRELGTKEPRVKSAHVQSKKETGPVPVGMKERSSSAPGFMPIRETIGKGLPAIYIDTGGYSPQPCDSSPFFVTEVASDTSEEVASQLPIFPNPRGGWGSSFSSWAGRNSETSDKGRKGGMSTFRIKTPASGPSTPEPARKRGSSVFELRRKVHPPSVFSVSFAQPKPSDNDQEYEKEEQHKQEAMGDPALEKKVKDFIDEITDFNAAHRLGHETKARTEFFPNRKRSMVSPLVAKRYNSWHIDQAALLEAFEQFCTVQTPEELNKVVRLAGKLKANIKVTRNQSIVPSIAVFKSTRTFKSLLGRDSS